MVHPERTTSWRASSQYGRGGAGEKRVVTAPTTYGTTPTARTAATSHHNSRRGKQGVGGAAGGSGSTSSSAGAAGTAARGSSVAGSVRYDQPHAGQVSASPIGE